MFPGVPLFLGFWVELTIFRLSDKNQGSYRQQKLQSFAVLCEREEKVLAVVSKHLLPRSYFSDTRMELVSHRILICISQRQGRHDDSSIMVEIHNAALAVFFFPCPSCCMLHFCSHLGELVLKYFLFSLLYGLVSN